MKTIRNLFKQDKEKFVTPKSVQDCIPIKTIYKDGITMTRFMEKWLANVQQDIIIEPLEEIIVENK